MTGTRHILLAEDDELDIELILKALKLGHIANPIDVVRDGAEVLDYLKRCGPYQQRPNLLPAVVLLDIKMPKLDGHEVLKSMRADRELRSVPVVMLTSSMEQVDLWDSYINGVNAYVVKPTDYQEFIEIVKMLGIFWGRVNTLPDPEKSATIRRKLKELRRY